MKRLCKTASATVVGLGALVLVAAPGFAKAEHHGATSAAPQPAATASTQLAHMGQGPAGGPGMMAPGQGYGPGCGTGSGMMGPGMMGPGMMGPGMMGPGMMGPGMMGPGMMGPGMGGQGMMGPDLGQAVAPSKDLSADDVRHFFEHRLEMHGNKRVKVGEVKEADDDTIVADIVTQDGSLVQRFKVDRHTGQMQQAE